MRWESFYSYDLAGRLIEEMDSLGAVTSYSYEQGIIKIVDGPESLYITDGMETSTIIFTGGK